MATVSKLTLLVLVVLALGSLSSAKLIFRSKRQVEREGQPASEIVVIKDKNGNVPSNTRYDLLPTDKDRKPIGKDDEEVDLKVDEEDGTFTFGGRLPDFHHFHGGFSKLFNVLQRHFDDMSRRFEQNFNSFSGTDVSKLPDNYNQTDTEIVTAPNGKRFIKKKTTIKKGGPNTQIFITSTVYEPVPDDSENVETGSEVGPAESQGTSGSPAEGLERET
jgi:hypothetical protein